MTKVAPSNLGGSIENGASGPPAEGAGALMESGNKELVETSPGASKKPLPSISPADISLSHDLVPSISPADASAQKISLGSVLKVKQFSNTVKKKAAARKRLSIADAQDILRNASGADGNIDIQQLIEQAQRVAGVDEEEEDFFVHPVDRDLLESRLRHFTLKAEKRQKKRGARGEADTMLVSDPCLISPYSVFHGCWDLSVTLTLVALPAGFL
jgi:hypothetical protein